MTTLDILYERFSLIRKELSNERVIRMTKKEYDFAVNFSKCSQNFESQYSRNCQ